MAGRRKRSKRLGQAEQTTLAPPATSFWARFTPRQKVLLVGVGIPALIALGYGGLILARVLKARSIAKNGTDGGVQVIDEAGPQVATSTDPRCQNLEAALKLPKGCGNARVLAYNRGVRADIVIGEIAGYGGHYLQRTPNNAVAAAERLIAAARAAGHQVTLNSSFRTLGSQTQLYKLYKSGKGAPAAPPGRSNHQYGMALDISVAAYPKLLQWLLANGPRYGWHKTVAREDWHYEYKPETDQMRSAPLVA